MQVFSVHSFKNAELCTQCGYCLPVCPTYRVENNELHSPRGRVSILLALQAAELTVAEAAIALDHCLVCRACHAACPAGVRPAKLVLTLRTQYPLRPTLLSALLHHVCNSPYLTAGLATVLALYQRSGLHRLVRGSRLLRFFPSLARLHSLLPQPRPPEQIFTGYSSYSTGQRIGLVSGCMARLFFPQVAPSAAQLLTNLGYQVIVIKQFGCCGSPFRESGQQQTFLRQARRTLDAFVAAGPLTAVVCDSSICAVTIRGYARTLTDDVRYAAISKTFAEQTEMLSQFLARQPSYSASQPTSSGSDPGDHSRMAPFVSKDPGFGSLAYQDHCQAQYGLGIMAEPRSLLAALPVANHELAPIHTGRQACCGTGGSYMLRYPERSQKVLRNTLDAIVASGADTVVGENPGCLMNIASGLEQTHTAVQVRHLAEVLRAAYPPENITTRK